MASSGKRGDDSPLSTTGLNGFTASRIANDSPWVAAILLKKGHAATPCRTSASHMASKPVGRGSLCVSNPLLLERASIKKKCMWAGTGRGGAWIWSLGGEVVHGAPRYATRVDPISCAITWQVARI